MKTLSTLLLSLGLILETQALNAKNAFIPYYMRNTDSSKINAIKTNQACGSCDCGDDSNSGENVNPFSKETVINLANQEIKARQQCSSCDCGDGDDIDYPQNN